jgi:RNA recognition motif-containing protein
MCNSVVMYVLNTYVLRPYEAELDEFHPKATRTLFIGNLEKDVTASELRKHFEQFGEIIVSQDCFLLYSVNSTLHLGNCSCLHQVTRVA